MGTGLRRIDPDSRAVITLELSYLDQRFDYTSGDLDYKGVNLVHKAATSATNWKIWKYTWTGTNLTRIEGPLDGSWDGRAALAWA